MNTTKSENNQINSPRIYVACLAAHNSGVLHGKWIEATQEPEDIHQEIQEMLSASPIDNAQEWAIHDHDNFHSLKVNGYESIEKVSEIALLIDEHEGAFAGFAENVGLEYATEDGFLDAFRGEYDSVETYAEELFYDCYTIPDFLQMYICWKSVARDLFCGDYYSIDSCSGRVYIFSCL